MNVSEERARQLAILQEGTLGDSAEERLLAEFASEKSQPTRKNFDFYANLEPRLLALRETARAFKRESEGKEAVCANRFWYITLKPQLVHLVGFERPVDGEPDEELPDEFDFADMMKRIQDEVPLRRTLIENLPADMQTLYRPHAYDVCYDAIYEELPDCKNCSCW